MAGEVSSHPGNKIGKIQLIPPMPFTFPILPLECSMFREADYRSSIDKGLPFCPKSLSSALMEPLTATIMKRVE